MKPFPSLQNKNEAFEEEKKGGNSPFCPNPIKFTKKPTMKPAPQRDPEIIPEVKDNPKQEGWTLAYLPCIRQRGHQTCGPHCLPPKQHQP